MNFLLNTKQKGFTIIELIVVIAIIAVLATIVLSSLQNYRIKADGTRMAQDLQAMEVALRLLKVEQKLDTWPRESTWAGSPPLVKNISGISQFLSTTISPPISGINYYYDNDGDTMVEGSCTCCSGVNIGLEVCPNCQQYFTTVDKIIDGGDGPCYGKVRSNGTSYSYLYYNLSTVETTN